MARTGRPPMTAERVQERIADYCRRYQVTETNDAGFPVFPAGRRETPQHREWIALYQLFNRARRRSAEPRPGDDASRVENCPVCLKPSRPPGAMHQRCAGVVDVVRELGPESLDRVRAAAFPSPARSAGSVRPLTRR